MITLKQERPEPDVQALKPTRLPPIDSENARRELIRRIVHSPTFGRSERLGTLLTFVCDLALKGREAEINEQRIGHAVFARSQDYDSSVDGIVRSQASRLRQRLHLYFEEEGAGELLRVSIPRGGYVPVFQAHDRLIAPALPITEPVEPVSQQIVKHLPQAQENAKGSLYNKRLPWIVTAVLALLLLANLVHDRTVRRAAGGSQTAHPLWSHLLKRKKLTMVVAPDSGLVLFHGLSGQDLDLKDYLDATYRSEPDVLPQIGPTATKRDSLLDLANRRYTSIVDLRTILSLKDKAEGLGSDISVRYARDLRPNDFKTGDVILLGSSEADPWIELYEHSVNFVFKDDYKGVYSILNSNPQSGEPQRWESRRDDPQRRVYGVVAYLPNLNGDGNALLLEGTGMSGAEAGMDFVLDDQQLLPFLERIKRHDGSIPHFSVLLETHNIGASAGRSRILAWRAID